MMKKYEKYEKTHIQALSIIYQIIACLFFSIAYLQIKVLRGISAGKVIYLGSIIPVVLVFMFCKYNKIAVYHKDKQILLLARGIFSSLGQVCINISLQYIPTSETVILSRLNLIWIAFISIYYFKTEKLRLSLIIIIVLCLIGVAMILRPPFIFNYFGFYDTSQLKDKNFGVIMAVAFSLTSSVAFSTLTALKGSGVHQFGIIMYFYFFSILFSSIYDIYHPSKQECSSYEYMIIILNGLCMLLGQFFMNRSYLLGQLNQITLFSQSQILLNYIFDITILNQDIHILSIIGMMIVSGCFTFNILYK